MNICIRPTKISDYPAVNAIGTASYPDNYYEGDASFESKMRGYSEGCFVADVDGVVGYAISFPYLIGRPYPIDEIFELEPEPNCYYIHDLCVLDEFRGKGIANKLAERVLEIQWVVIALVAVMYSSGFWRLFGFKGFASLDYYGLKAEYMLLIRDKLR
jgi:ribosomal protein S18 acetylase RimI-like enzyme